MNLTIHAADVISYGVLKGQKFFQFGPSSPFPASTAFEAFVMAAAAGSLSEGTVQPPGGGALVTLDPLANPNRFTYEEEFSSLGELNTTYPNGSYVVQMTGANDGAKTATLNLTGDSYPNTPTISNYSETQAINPTAAFTLAWGTFSGGSANDFVQVLVTSFSTGTTVYQSPDLGAAGALNGTATSVVIPANTLAASQSYSLNLTFAKILNRDTTSYPGATGVSGYFKETQVLAMTGSGGPGPGPDTNAPTLSYTTPVTNASRVPVNTQVVFAFNEPMAPTNSIEWSGNISAANFICTWSADARTLTCVYNRLFPTNSVITWNLKGFKDVAGNSLAPVSGQFTTSCEELPPASSNFSLSKSADYEQTSAGVPILGTNSSAFVSAFVHFTNVTPVTEATLQLPNGVISNLFSFTGNDYFLFGSFNTENALAAAYPPGAYTFRLKRADGTTSSATLTLNVEPNVPQISNYAETQSVNPDADFVLRWIALAGATTNDFISLSISDTNGMLIFQAPERCIPIRLLPTDTSITIPRGTFKAGDTYRASLGFFKFGARDTTSIPGIPGSASFSKLTSFEIRTTGTGSQPTAPKFTTFTRSLNGSFQLSLSGQASVTYVIEASPDLKTWTAISTNSSPSGVISFTDSGAASLARRFYRARSSP